jgi:DNA helicase II / ATP-dependent DNA helicase PcrA
MSKAGANRHDSGSGVSMRSAPGHRRETHIPLPDEDAMPPSPPTVAQPSLLEGLTEPQQRAVLCTEGPLLVLAAAGSGKTRVITRRIAHLIGMGVPPWSILALTFTNKAAGEMRERVETLLRGADGNDRRYRGLTVTTFHSLCARLLRRYAEAAGLKPEFSIYDSGDQWTLCKKTVEALEMSTSNWPPRSVLATISAAKNELLDAAAYAARAGDFYSKSLSKIYTAYEKALRAAGAVDFDDLLVLTAKLLRDNAQVRAELRSRWQYILIDEYQDTNHAQLVIATLLAGEPTGKKPKDDGEPAAPAAVPNICVVGDPDQAIYGWRGADISNILQFEEQYPGAKVITLGENFRSTAPILAVADKLIRNNKRRKHKDLFTSKHGGERVQVTLCRDEQHEASLIVDWMKRLQAAPDGAAWREMAVFYRTNALSRVMEDAFRAAGVPYTIARGTAFYEREEIKNALSYLRLVANRSDDVSLSRIVNMPTRGIGEASMERIELHARQAGSPIYAIMAAMGRDRELDSLAPRATGAVGKFVEMVEEWTGGGTFLGSKVPTSLSDLVERVIKESGLEKMYDTQAKTSGSDADAQRLDNLSELVSSARQFEMEFDVDSDPAEFPGADVLMEGRKGDAPPLLSMLRAYLESIALVADADTVDPAQGAVTLMTLHAAKGLEFSAAAIIGLEEGLLPHSRAQESEDQLEEERRLCFVGITRAMKHLQITSAKYRTIRGVAERTIRSRFLEEFDPQNTHVSDQADVLSGLEGTTWVEPSRSARGAHSEPASTPSASNNGGFTAGTKVRHPQFGLGTIKSVSGGSQARAVVQFDGVGVKTLVLEYARLQIVR